MVKTDLDEKYIIKESTVTLFPKGSDEIIARIERNSEKYVKKYDQSYANHERLLKNDVFKSDIKIEPEKVHWIEVTFRPIFVDINKDKSALGYKSIACPNPKLKSNTFKAWNYFGGPYSYKSNKLLAYEVTGTPINAIEKVQKKICDKYAKF